ncbi:Copia protein [Gossypium australe]|uniref:Copia protein n=1 Tax=Gossypium australe TaxID=47621 RepID=A0A5B6VQ75_9ROSI|nr:Copia protein [Gossypium australe]
MMEVFDMNDLGDMHYFLGMEIKQSQNKVFLCQKKYMKEILKRFYMEECKSVSTSMNQKEKLQKTDRADPTNEKEYRRLVGCLIVIHMIVAKSVLRYLKGTLAYGINFSKVEKFKLQGYSDSDWAGSLDDMRSTSGYCFTFGSVVSLGVQESKIWNNIYKKEQTI